MKSVTKFLTRILCAAAVTPLTLSAATIPGLFNTGVDANGVALAAGASDPHYLVTVAAQGTINTGAIVMQNNAAWLANSAASTWIGVVNSGAANVAVGNYFFRTTFDLTGLEPSSAQISFKVSVDNDMVDVVLNGNSSGLSFSGFGGFGPTMTISSGFVDGLNTLEFRTVNGGTAVNPGGFRAEFVSGTADVIPPPGTPPSITTQPVGQTNGIGESATFTVAATGSRPLFYEWRFGGTALPNATNSSLTLNSLGAANDGTYEVVVSNASGSVTSSPVVLRVVFLSPSQLSYEPIGASSRRTGLTFSEIMFHPKDRTDGRNIEFIEIYNSNPFPEDISGYRLSGDGDYTFPANTFVPGFGYVVVAPKPADVQAVYGISGVFGPLTNATYVADAGMNILPNSSGTIRLRKASSGLVLEVAYTDEAPWPAAADGAGPSMILARPSYGEGDAKAWAASAFIGGSPGAADPVPAGPLENIVINEILANTDEPARDYVELHNHSSLPVDLSGCYLTDERNTNHFRIPDGVSLPPKGKISFDQDQLGFALSSSGETVYLINPGQNRVLDALRFGGQANGVAYGRFPDGAPAFQELIAQTPGGTNAVPLLRNIVINEILYNPISGNDNDEFVELFNRGATPVDLTGWRFEDGISFTFPANTIIPAGGYLVVAADVERMLTNYPGLDSSKVIGDFSGNLANGGERLALAMPEYGLATNGNVITTNVFYVVMDEVTYVDGGSWGKWSDGGGSSLELIDAHSDNRLPSNWADSDETAKSAWTTVEHTGVLDLNHPAIAAFDQLHIFLLDLGEVLVDDVEVIHSGVNRVTNPGLEGGLTGWFFHGSHRPSFLENSGFNSSRSLHVVATDRGDVVNRVRTQLSLSPTLGSTVTLRAKARWLKGHPELLLRLIGSPLEVVGTLAVPRNLGTPGAPNSRAVANAGPAISGVTHRPILPKAGQSIRVSARVQDPDGVPNVSVVYRLDPQATLNTVPMADNGLNGDLLAGDGIYTGIIPGQANGALVAFRVQAADGFAPPANSQFPADAPTRECLVRVGEALPPGGFATYRIWMTQATFDAWTAREKSSNEDNNTTFVYGDTRVIYNVGARFGSSENYSTILTTPTGTLVGYNLTVPDDDLLLGESGVRLDWPNRDTTMLREVTMYWLLDQYGLPNHYRRFIHLHINGVRRGTIYNDTQRPNGDSVEEWYPDDTEGELFKLNPWFEANAAGAINAGSWVPPRLQNFTTTGGVTKTAYYRFAWMPRAVQGSANNYTNLFALISAANAPTNGYQSAVESLVDLPNWMRTFAMNDLASYWDAFGNPNSKNSYLYRPENSGWKIMCWDFDVGLGTGNGQAEELPTAALFGSTGNDPGLNRMYATPFIVRHYWNALDEAVFGFFQPSAVNTFLADRYAAFQAAGIDTVSPFVPSGIVPGGQPQLSIPNWITARRNYILTQLNTVSNVFNVTGTDFITTGTNLVTLTGTAPVRVLTITVNGVEYTPVWTTVNAWRLVIPVTAGTNVLEIAGLDRLGNVVSNITRTVDYIGADELAEDNVVINEIMYNPLVPGSSFVELFNRSATYSFDISGWRLNGVDFTFPRGTVITNRGFLVICKDRTAFGNAYGWGIPVVGMFDGQLDNGGETITLIKPGATPAQDLVVDRVTYDDEAPWLATADGQGSSLQLIDAAQDNNRVSNWSDGTGWRYFTHTAGVGSANLTRLSLFFETAGGDVYLDDMSMVIGSEPETGANVLVNGDFESPLSPAWVTGPLGTNSVIAPGVARTGNSSLHLIVAPGSQSLTTFYQDFPALTAATNYTLSFWYLTGGGGTNFNFRLNNLFRNSLNPASRPFSPGVANTATASLPPYPALWISEVQPDNVSTLADNAGDNDPWIELYNGATTPLSLDGYYLAHSYSNLSQWAFPAGTVINPGQYLLVWADGEPGETIAGNLHTSFRLNQTNGAVALSRNLDGSLQLVDYLNYSNVGSNRSVGTYPPGQASFRQVFSFPTPRGTNNPASPPVTLFLNEWMAANGSFLRDPMDLDFDDWFEIYNPTTNRVDLTGFSLTDDELRPRQSVVPAGISVPAQGYLLVWADEETGQTRTDGDLHVDFRLGQGGERIALYDPSGRQIDLVVFGAQNNNVSQGRWPNGGPAPYYFMPTPTPRAPNQIPVANPVVVTPIIGPGNAVTLSWTSQPGTAYRVEYKDDLGAASWSALAGDVSATGTTASKADQNNGTQRFYRVRQLP